MNQKSIKKIINYDPETGVFTWKPREGNKRFNTRHAGKDVGCKTKQGYLITHISGKSIRLHVLAWIYMTGIKPKYIDHVNGNKSDNRFSNLRECTASQNMHNSGIKPDNKSGYKGVRWNKQVGKWQAVVKKDYKSHHAGLFNDAKEAAKAYDKKAIELHGEFAKTNEMLGLL